MTKRKRQPTAMKTLKQSPPRLPVLVRQTKVFELVVQGHTYEQICKRLGMSEDTIARDMEAIAADVLAIVQQRHGEVLAVALATYQQVQQQAWAEYWLDVERERAWLAGELDYTRVQRVQKTLGVGPTSDPPAERRDPADDDDDDEANAGLFEDFINSLETDDPPAPTPTPTPPAGERSDSQESLPLEIKTTETRMRPAWRSNRERWLQLALTSTREMTTLCGLNKLKIEHSGSVNHEHTLTLEQWKAQASQRLAAAEETLALQDEDDNA